MEGCPGFRDLASIVLQTLGTLCDARNLLAVNKWWRAAIVRYWAAQCRQRLSAISTAADPHGLCYLKRDVRIAHAIAEKASDDVLISFAVLWEHAERLCAKTLNSPVKEWRYWGRCAAFLVRVRYLAFYNEEQRVVTYPPKFEDDSATWHLVMTWPNRKRAQDDNYARDPFFWEIKRHELFAEIKLQYDTFWEQIQC